MGKKRALGLESPDPTRTRPRGESDADMTQSSDFASFTYASAAGVALGMSEATPEQLRAFDKEEYDEYMRALSWREKSIDLLENRLKSEHIRRIQKEESIEDWSKVQEMQEQTSRRVQERERRQRLKEELMQSYKRQYVIQSNIFFNQRSPVTLENLPWPLYPPSAYPGENWPSPEEIDAKAVSRFLLLDTRVEDRKTILRNAQLAYHPDRFGAIIQRCELSEEAKLWAMERAVRVSQALNELMEVYDM